MNLKKLTIKEVSEELFKIKSATGDLLLATADFGVEKGGALKYIRSIYSDMNYVDSLIKEIRNDALTIRQRCISGHEDRKDGAIFSKIGKNRVQSK